jgi:ATP adenylyltransferase
MDKLWAPWRVEYIRNPGKGCFLCQSLKLKDPAEAFILEKRSKTFTIMNRYPYNNGHVMIAPTRHVGTLELLDDDELQQINNLVIRTLRALTLSMNPQGFNIGINQGHVAGAGLVDHIHVHIVPRWQGDTNFMPVTGDTKVVSEALCATYDKIKEALHQLDNP